MSNWRFLTRSVNLRSVTGLAAPAAGPKAQRFFYKQGSDAKAIQVEATELHRIAAMTLGATGVCVPKLRCHDATQNLLVMEHIGRAASLFNYLWNNTRWWDIRRVGGFHPGCIGRSLGSWLREYHASSSMLCNDVAEYHAALLSSAERKLEAIVGAGSGILSDECVGRVKDVMRAYRSGCTGRRSSGTICTIHGDLELSNVLVAGSKRIVVVDFSDSRHGFPEEDFLRLWNGIWALSQTSPLRSRLLRPCLESLEKAYGFDRLEADRDLVRVVKLGNWLCNLWTLNVLGRQLGYGRRRYVLRLTGVYRRRLEEQSVLWGKEIVT